MMVVSLLCCSCFVLGAGKQEEGKACAKLCSRMHHAFVLHLLVQNHTRSTVPGTGTYSTYSYPTYWYRYIITASTNPTMLLPAIFQVDVTM